MSRAGASLLILLGALLALLWLAPEVPLLGFAAVLLATALRLPAGWVAKHTGMRRWVAVLALAGTVVLVLGLGGWLAAGPLSAQANQLIEDLPEALATLRERLGQGAVTGWLSERLRPEALAGSGGAMASSAAAAAGTTLGALGNAVLVLLMGIYLAVAPATYRRGLVALAHPDRRARLAAVLGECGEALRGWLLGQGFAMVVSGTLTWLGLMALGVPLAGVLAVLAALLGFIPYLGPVIAAVPAMLLALTESPVLALWVAALFVAVQNVEGNLLTPMVQQRAADLPPVLLLLAQVLMGALFGLLGVALAAPAAAVGLVLVRRLYVEDWLERPPGQASSESALAPAPVPARETR